MSLIALLINPRSSSHQCDCGPSGIGCTCPKNNCNCDNCDSCVNKQHSSQCYCKGTGVSCDCTNQQRACNCATKWSST
ncbi:uncharacterized protein F5891DRAFT_1019053 [Suillus fuscotomentosus]|uniref:Metallothionein n=1 Tax=Suillus fuscotomentosus TaxID=1912939 RepID=A0AAD4EE91_9AGAM|nr:uncharacterized protein F5891DRAFT_1019053 [Suillus fuscotomentosus]KAG1903379.1 hypothetical protein F5891DRAFT_1019053 [Suillus fuscotomentosus]